MHIIQNFSEYLVETTIILALTGIINPSRNLAPSIRPCRASRGRGDRSPGPTSNVTEPISVVTLTPAVYVGKYVTHGPGTLPILSRLQTSESLNVISTLVKLGEVLTNDVGGTWWGGTFLVEDPSCTIREL
jgi:hypothetical protein